MRVFGGSSTLVTYPQLGQSYAVNPGSPATGAMLTTSSIAARQRGHGRVPAPPLLLNRSDTIRAPCVRAGGISALSTQHWRRALVADEALLYRKIALQAAPSWCITAAIQRPTHLSSLVGQINSSPGTSVAAGR
jgi:hypothetical protein